MNTHIQHTCIYVHVTICLFECILYWYAYHCLHHMAICTTFAPIHPFVEKEALVGMRWTEHWCTMHDHQIFTLAVVMSQWKFLIPFSSAGTIAHLSIWLEQKIASIPCTWFENSLQCHVGLMTSKVIDHSIIWSPVCLGWQQQTYQSSTLLVPWCRHQMETFSALLAICAGNSPITGEFPTQRPVTRSFDVFFDPSLNKRLSKQSWSWWFETPSRSLWRHRKEGSHR